MLAWRLMASYKSGYMGYKYSYPLITPLITTHEPPSGFPGIGRTLDLAPTIQSSSPRLKGSNPTTLDANLCVLNYGLAEDLNTLKILSRAPCGSCFRCSRNSHRMSKNWEVRFVCLAVDYDESTVGVCNTHVLTANAVSFDRTCSCCS